MTVYLQVEANLDISSKVKQTKREIWVYPRGGGEVCNVPISRREKENANEKVNSQTQLEKIKQKQKIFDAVCHYQIIID